jgi:hypothetical protein
LFFARMVSNLFFSPLQPVGFVFPAHRKQSKDEAGLVWQKKRLGRREKCLGWRRLWFEDRHSIELHDGLGRRTTGRLHVMTSEWERGGIGEEEPLRLIVRIKPPPSKPFLRPGPKFMPPLPCFVMFGLAAVDLGSL